MKRLILLAATALIIVSCDIALFDEKLSLDDNPFIFPIVIESGKEGDDTLDFIVISDAHLNRELRDSNIWRNTDNFLLFIEESDVDAVLLLGDMIDDAVDIDYESMHSFLSLMKERLDDGTPIIYTLGNHDANKGSSVEAWEKEFGQGSMEAYRISDTMIYKLNSSFRIFGHDQLKALEDAMRNNRAGYNIILTHVPLGAKGLDQSLFEFTIADIDERNALLKIIDENGSTLTFSGHHHKGAVLNSWSDRHKEHIFSAFHKRDLFGLESEGYYFLVRLNQQNGDVSILGFQIDNANPEIDNPDIEVNLHI